MCTFFSFQLAFITCTIICIHVYANYWTLNYDLQLHMYHFNASVNMHLVYWEMLTKLNIYPLSLSLSPFDTRNIRYKVFNKISIVSLFDSIHYFTGAIFVAKDFTFPIACALIYRFMPREATTSIIASSVTGSLPQMLGLRSTWSLNIPQRKKSISALSVGRSSAAAVRIFNKHLITCIWKSCLDSWIISQKI